MKLLNKNPSERIGCKDGINEIMKHKWFKNFDWKKIKQEICMKN